MNLLDLKIFSVKHETQEALFSFQDQGDGLIEAQNLDGILAASKDANFEQIVLNGGLAAYQSLPDPLPKLVITHPDFDADVFMVNGKLLMMSERAREALSFPETDVQVIPVDDSESLPSMQAKNFMFVHFPIVFDAIDPDKSLRATWEGIYGPGMEAVHPTFDPPFNQYTLKDDFVPTAAIFHIARAPEGPFVASDFDIKGLADVALYDTHSLLTD